MRLRSKNLFKELVKVETGHNEVEVEESVTKVVDADDEKGGRRMRTKVVDADEKEKGGSNERLRSIRKELFRELSV